MTKPMQPESDAPVLPFSWNIVLPADPRLLSMVRTFLEAICQLGRLDDETACAVLLATHEAASNVIRHAHRSQPAAPLRIRCTITPGGVEVVLEDQGEPFDIQSVPQLDPGEVRAGGRGVFLIRKLMDEQCSRSLPGGGNSLRMFKRFAGAS